MSKFHVFLLALSFAACGRSGGDAPASNPAPVEDPVAADAPPTPRGPRWSTEFYDLTATADGAGYRVGQLGQIAIALSPKGAWHVNQEYPVRVELSSPSGVSFAKTVLERSDAAEFDERHFRFAAPVTPTAAGSHDVLATVSFAVCEEANCLPQTETLSLAVQVQ